MMEQKCVNVVIAGYYWKKSVYPYIYIYILISFHFADLKSEFIINMLSSCVIVLAFKMLI